MHRLQPVRQQAHNPALPVSRLLLECSQALPDNLHPASPPVLPVNRLLVECRQPVNQVRQELPALPAFRLPERVLLRR